jgi:hypothetical protein
VLHHADVRSPIPGDWDAGLAGDNTGHAGGPEQLVAQVRVDELLRVAEECQAGSDVGRGRGDELGQGLGIVGRDKRVRERRA